MEKLTKLQLDNNIIMKIEGLDELVNLTWLDLSFNLIEKIEGLDNNTQLQDLSLFTNNITELEGLDKLTNLNVLSVGCNQIKSLDHTIKYLQKLNNKNLEVLKIEKNKFQELDTEKDWRKQFIACLKELKYLDYKIIDEKERLVASEECKEEMQENNDNDASNAAKEGMEMSGDTEELKDAKIEIT